MALFKIEYFSEILDMEETVNVIYPDRSRVTDPECQDIPVLYLLHGMGGNSNSWLKRTTLERLVRYTNLIVVLPDTHNGWYTNTQYGYAYYDVIATELPQVLKRFFPNMSDKREKNFIAGLSMGGYGAFKIAMKTNRFSYAASLSGALSFKGLDDQASGLGNSAYWQGIFGDLKDIDNHPDSLLTIAKGFDKKTHLYAWCGEQDFLYAANNQAIADFKNLEIEIDYQTSPGKHEWYYWNQQLETVLKWLPIDFELEERLS